MKHVAMGTSRLHYYTSSKCWHFEKKRPVYVFVCTIHNCHFFINVTKISFLLVCVIQCNTEKVVRGGAIRKIYIFVMHALKSPQISQTFTTFGEVMLMKYKFNYVEGKILLFGHSNLLLFFHSETYLLGDCSGEKNVTYRVY